jgi:Zn-dependent protease
MEHLSVIQTFTVYVLPILFAITVHEVAHGWMAKKLGDKTAYILGRITLNPFKHIDLIGTVLVPLIMMLFGGVIFGWAKPVPINFANLRNPRRDVALVSLAGPLSNLIMAFFWALIAKIGILAQTRYNLNLAEIFVFMGQAGIQVNLVFMILNLIPIPPLDGGRILSMLLPLKMFLKFNRLEPYGFFILLILLGLGVLNYIIVPCMLFFSKIIFGLFGL